jgi:hypothetical protein
LALGESDNMQKQRGEVIFSMKITSPLIRQAVFAYPSPLCSHALAKSTVLRHTMNETESRFSIE